LIAFGAQENRGAADARTTPFCCFTDLPRTATVGQPLTATAGPLLVLEKNDQIDHRNDQFAHFARQDYTSF
jgi:hypothetical protein